MSSPMLPGLPEAALTVLSEAALKGTALLALAALAMAPLRRASAAQRHLVWVTAIAGLLALPLLSAALPRWRVVSVAAPLAIQTPQPSAEPVASNPAPDATLEKSDAKDAAPGSELSPSAGPTPYAGANPAAPARSLPWPALLLALWALGATAVLGVFVGGHIALRRLMREAQPCADAEWLALAQVCAGRLGLKLPFALLRSSVTGIPLTLGLVRPRVLLPADAAAWSEDRRRDVLLHELAHVQRGDCLTQALAQLACALFWFHPGAWYAARRLRIERERACDDRVVSLAARASDYADHLLEVVRTRRDSAVVALGAVPFAHRSNLEGRLLAVLDPHVRREALSPRLITRVAAVAALVVLPLAALAPTAGARRETHAPLDPDAAAPSVVLRAPEQVPSLEKRMAWARAEASRRGDGSYWIGWRIAAAERQKGGVMGDSQGFDLELLDADYAGPTLDDVLAGRAPIPNRERHEKHEPSSVAVLLLGRNSGAGGLERVRFQSSRLPTDLRRKPLYWLGDVPDEQSVPMLRDLAERSSDLQMKRELVDAIGVHSRSDLVVPYLAHVLDSGGPDELRAGAAESFARHPSRATQERLVRTAREDRSTEVRRAAVEALGQLGTPEALDALIDLTRETGDESVRRGAFDALGEKIASGGKEPAEAPEAATPAVSEEAPAAPETPAATALAPAAPAPAPVEPTPYAPKAMKVKQAHLGSGDSEVQRQAVEALGKYPEEQSLPRLMQLLDHPDPDVARQAVESIGRIGSPASVSVLTKIAWQNPSDDLRREAVEMIGHQVPEAQSLPLLVEIARSHRSDDTRRQAVESIGRFEDHSVVKLLADFARNPDDTEVARQAVECLGRRPEPGLMKVLADIARTHPCPDVRRQAVESMTKLNPDEALPYLEAILKSSRKS